MDMSNLQVLAEIFKKELDGIHLSDQLALLVIEAVIICVIGLTVGRKRKLSWKKLLIIYLLLAYLGLLFSITIFRRPWGSRDGIVHLTIRLGFGLKTGHPSFWISAYSVYNILLFIPFGILASMVLNNRNKLRGVIVTTIIGVLLSLLVESIQLVTGRGMFEISDLVTNAAGGFIGALIYEGITRKQISVS